MLSKSTISEELDNSNNSFSSFFSSSINSFSYLNENGKRKIDKQLALPQRPRQLFGPLLRTTSCSSSISENLNLDKNKFFQSPLQKKNEKLTSPSTEFSKLDISFINPCFDSNKTQLESTRQANTSTAPSSSVFSKDLENNLQLIKDIDTIESRPCTSLYPVNLITTCENPMFENPIFSLSSKNLYPKLEHKTDVTDFKTKKEKNVDEKTTNSKNNPSKHLSSNENQKRSSFSSCKSLMRNMIRKNHHISQSSDLLINEVNDQYKDKIADDKKLDKPCYFEHCNSKKISDNFCYQNHKNKDLFFERLNRCVGSSNPIRCINLFSKKTKINILPTVHDVNDFENQETNLKNTCKDVENLQSHTYFKKSSSNSSINESKYNLNTGKKKNEFIPDINDINKFENFSYSLTNSSNSLYPKIILEESYSDLYSSSLNQNSEMSTQASLKLKTSSTSSLHQLITTSTPIIAPNNQGTTLINNENNSPTNIESTIESACRDPERSSLSSTSSLEISVK